MQKQLPLEPAGVVLHAVAEQDTRCIERSLREWMEGSGLDERMVSIRHLSGGSGPCVALALKAEQFHYWTPDFDTLNLGTVMPTANRCTAEKLEAEVLVALLANRNALTYPSLAELQASVRIRTRIAMAARATHLAFDVHSAERPERYWEECEENGFLLRPGASLINALRAATQPTPEGGPYTFSCYRASEYVILLGLCEVLQELSPALLARIEQCWRKRPFRSAAFHRVFMLEVGSRESPVPMRHYVPGDRVWFRNPDPVSSSVHGYEGSWVIYLGNGEFSDFWRANTNYTLESKCAEIFHWRHAVEVSENGESCIDEDRVADLIAETAANPTQLGRVLAVMERYREPAGQYTTAGGCIDLTREYVDTVLGPDSAVARNIDREEANA